MEIGPLFPGLAHPKIAMRDAFLIFHFINRESFLYDICFPNKSETASKITKFKKKKKSVGAFFFLVFVSDIWIHCDTSFRKKKKSYVQIW